MERVRPYEPGVPATGRILTQTAWQSLSQVAPGTPLCHPDGRESRLVEVVPLGTQPVVRIMMADGTSFAATVEQPVDVLIGNGEAAAAYTLTVAELHDALARGCKVRLPRQAPFRFGVKPDADLDEWLLGVLIGDGYLRRSSTTLCNQQEELHEIVRTVLPDGVRLKPMHVGQAGTGSADFVGEIRNVNPMLATLRSLGLGGKRAWEKYVPEPYLIGDVDTRLGLLQGLFDTDASIDSYGRIEFSSASQQLTLDAFDLVASLGGRARYTVKTKVNFTSPRQTVRKPGRTAYRLINIRLPEGLSPFRLPAKADRVRVRKFARQWMIKAVEPIGFVDAVGVVVSAADGRWVGDGYVAHRGLNAAVRESAA